jgi:cob(I)alamin adenosyltransferase
LEEVKNLLHSGAYQVFILDEANIAVYFDLFSVEELAELIRSRPDHVEIVITGRRAHPRILELADLVTEMREVKHYYTQGVKARPGIET